MTIRRKTTHFRRLVVAATAVGAVLALGACESGERAPAAAADNGAKVVAPGKPGEPAKILSAKEAAEAVPADTPNAADVMYTQMMITHHAQALEMTALAPKQAGSAKVKRLAERISAAQGPEIGAMRGWLAQHGESETMGGHEHHHGAMPGMATEAQLGELRAAKGKAFDTLFLKLMITHHQGAITMATDVLGDGNNILVQEMANDVISQQSAEIHRMESMS
ncbi:DUF305 domain-containing protein [Streptomyces sannanensis]|uniref:DUF305 domain-containing protein n=1 Tax=Streptomyces sannanensis TaxID=285536 RepID=A0ABP6S4T7_9ACTN